MKKIILKRSYKEAGLPLHYSLSPSTSTEHENSANRIDEDSHPSCVSISPSEEEESNDWIAVTCFNNRVFAGRLENKENSLKCDFIIKKGDMEVIDNFHFVLKLVHYDQASDFNTWYYDSLTNLDTRLEEFQQRGSNAALDKIVCLELNIAKFDPMKGGSYIALSKKIKRNHHHIIDCLIKNKIIHIHQLKQHFQEIKNSFNGSTEFDGVIEVFLKKNSLDKYLYDGLITCISHGRVKALECLINTCKARNINLKFYPFSKNLDIWRWKWIILNNKIKEVLVYMNGEAREHLYISNYWRLKWFGGWANEVTIKEMVRIVKTILAYEEVGAIYVEEEVERNLFQKLFKMVDVITAWD
ncbi:uncharacterized protein LOC123291004 isoform X1 [Chrysoperla carnea]|uniref:uncharacterized protein LOC123291004 isoform X1 n=1 Tax=Chrysoperla carnea TaxID=189513 RepID=UPI001D08C6F1|nr:uncharacterized protein LOC123291004 isoform X1 [Chrysoperla carnea]